MLLVRRFVNVVSKSLWPVVSVVSNEAIFIFVFVRSDVRKNNYKVVLFNITINVKKTWC